MAAALELQPSTNVRDMVDCVREAAERFHIVSLNRQIEVCEGLLSRNPLIDVAILGQFKAGKSSFINSLTGRDILPVGVIPVTTVVTRLSYGEPERATVVFLDGTRTEVGIEALGEYISEARNPSNEKQVSMVDIELPSLSRYPGLRLVDTPGLGSVFTYHKEVSENWLPEVGAAILAISADRPLSENDLDLIEDLSHHTPRIVILLTKADLLTPDQQAEVEQFFRKTLKKKLDRDFTVYPYSIRSGTEALRQRISSDLFEGISANRDQEFRRILHFKTQSLLSRCLSYLEVARSSSMEADQDREALKGRILDEKVALDRVREEVFLIARENQGQTRVLLKKHLDAFEAPLTEKVRTQLSREIPTWKGNLWKLTRRYEEWLADTMTDEIGQISRTENPHFFGTLNKAHRGLMRYLETFRLLLGESISRVLGIRLPDADWKIEVAEPEHPDIRVLYAFDIHWDLIWFLIPMVIFRPLFERHFLSEVSWAAEVNLSRLAAQWETRINKAIEAMKNQALAYIEEELVTIDALLSNTHGRTGELDDLISLLKSWQNGL
ncbi:MAG TPA: dynamin family protein [Deltaproteobacteria bacterium]|nr:dynamin family protein [Deltaproteobacteria bacterium]HPA76876.1 dynamin family protein [Deltaproteobacteria bacterium]HUM21167.1 dynamin family protein [Deltaproteobacteria bacterium]